MQRKRQKAPRRKQRDTPAEDGGDYKPTALQREQDSNILHDITHELGRLLVNMKRSSQSMTDLFQPPGPVNLFLSHAKKDSLPLVEQFIKHIEWAKMDHFFDRKDINPGQPFHLQMMGTVDSSHMLVFLTDYYASRPWCQREVLRAKQKGRAVLVIDALKKGEARSFPYLGNTPTIRVPMSYDADGIPSIGPEGFNVIVGYLLREVVRAEHFRLYVDKVKQQIRAVTDEERDIKGLPYAPELLTALEVKKQHTSTATPIPLYIYPDPPVTAAESDLLTELDPRQAWSTPTILLSNPTGTVAESPLRGVNVGLTISDSPDLLERGFGPAGFNDAYSEICRHLLSTGAVIHTAHDFRAAGVGEMLKQLTQAYYDEIEDQLGGKDNKPIYWYLTPTAAEALTKNPILDQELLHMVKWHPLEAMRPEGKKPAENLTENLAVWTQESMVRARMEMNGLTHARVFVGGKLTGYQGPTSGVLEEAWLAMREKKAIFLLGGFGGATEELICILKGQSTGKLGREAAFREVPMRETVFERCKKRFATLGLYQPSFDPPEGVPIGPSRWWEGLNNGLSREENERLAVTTQIPEMVALVLKGLRYVAQSQPRGSTRPASGSASTGRASFEDANTVTVAAKLAVGLMGMLISTVNTLSYRTYDSAWSSSRSPHRPSSPLRHRGLPHGARLHLGTTAFGATRSSRLRSLAPMQSTVSRSAFSSQLYVHPAQVDLCRLMRVIRQL